MTQKRNTPLSNYEYWAIANRTFGECVSAQGFGHADMVYGFNAASVELFQAARNQGLRTALDQTMAPWATVETSLAEERMRWPDWDTSRAEQGWEILAEREKQEWDTADVIICGSSYVVQAMSDIGAPVECCKVVPYGYDGAVDTTSDAQQRTFSQDGPLRVLFVGTVDLRKGIPYLMQAAEELGRRVAEVRIVGPIGISDAALSRLEQIADVRGPVPRSSVREHYRWADVFVLPTLAEGSANVCYEAMAHGLPVITTPNAGSVVRDGQDGWIIPVRSTEAMVERITQLADNRELIRAASNSASQWAATFTWKRYGTQLVDAVRDITRPVDQPQTHISAF